MFLLVDQQGKSMHFRRLAGS